MDIKLESEDANFSFPEVPHSGNPEGKTSNRGTSNGIGLTAISASRTGNGTAGTVGRVIGVTKPRPAMGVLGKRSPITHQGPVTLTSQLCTFFLHFRKFF